jgi:hypothetical protein
MISISFAPLPVGSNGASGPTNEADAAGFGSAMSAAGGKSIGISFMPLLPEGPGAPVANPGIPQGALVAGGQLSLSQLPSNPLSSPPGAGPRLNPFFELMQRPSQPDALVQAQRAMVEDRMNGLRDIFAAALARDQANRPVQDIIGGAVRSAADRQASNEAALAPTTPPAIPPAMAEDAAPPQPGVVANVGPPVAVEGAAISLPDEPNPAESVAATIKNELDKSKAERSISEMMKSELEKAKADRPIDETVSGDLEKSRQDRPIGQSILDSLIAGKDELKLSEEAEQKLLATVAGEEGTLDSAKRKELLENANVMLQEKYQAIIDSFTARLAKSPPPGLEKQTA